jgi:hypothetical protein
MYALILCQAKNLKIVDVILSLLESEYKNMEIVDKVVKIIFSISLVRQQITNDSVEIVKRLLLILKKLMNHSFPIVNFSIAILYNFRDNKECVEEMIRNDGLQQIIDVFNVVFTDSKRFSPPNAEGSIDSALSVVNLIPMTSKAILIPHTVSGSEPGLAQILENILKLLEVMSDALPENKCKILIEENSPFNNVMFSIIERYLNLFPRNELLKKAEEIFNHLLNLKINTKMLRLKNIITKANKIYKKSLVFKIKK